MANKKHLARLQQGVTAWNQWRDEHREIQPDLSGANLVGANLQEANLVGANLQRAGLIRANLQEAHLDGAILCWASLAEG